MIDQNKMLPNVIFQEISTYIILCNIYTYLQYDLLQRHFKHHYFIIFIMNVTIFQFDVIYIFNFL